MPKPPKTHAVSRINAASQTGAVPMLVKPAQETLAKPIQEPVRDPLAKSAQDTQDTMGRSNSTTHPEGPPCTF
ncbi:MAG: hypothetical protein ACK5LO_06850 [Leucobacter sp.]